MILNRSSRALVQQGASSAVVRGGKPESSVAPIRNRKIPSVGFWLIVVGALVTCLMLAVAYGRYEALLVGVAAVGTLVLVEGFIVSGWLRQPINWLYLLIAYYPVHITVYKLITPELPSSASPILAAWDGGIIGGLFAAGLVRGLRRLPFRPMVLDYLVAAWLFTSVTSSVYSPDISLIIGGFRMTYMPVFLYFIIRVFPFQRISDYRRLVDFILVISGIIAIVGIVFYFVVPLELLDSWHHRMDSGLAFYQDILRMDSVFYSPVVFGSLMALAGTLCFALSFSNRKGARQKYLLGMGLFSFCCIMSMSRGAWVAAIVGIIVVSIAERTQGLGRSAIATSLILLVVLAWMVYSGNNNPFIRHVRTLFEAPEEGTGQIERIEEVEKGWADIVRNPLGHGLGNSGHVATWFQERMNIEGHVSINDHWYLKVLQESGIVGFTCFLLLIAAFLLCAYRGYRMLPASHHRNLVIGMGAAFIGFCIEGYGSNVWDFFMLGPIYWMLVGSVANIIAEGAKQHSPSRTSTVGYRRRRGEGCVSYKPIP